MTISERGTRLRNLAGSGLLCVAFIYAVSLAGCSESQVITTLGLVVDAAEAAVAALSPSLPPGVGNLITGYLQQVGNGVVKAGPILASTESAAQKAADVTALFTGALAPNLPAGTPQAIVLAVQAVATAVANFLKTLPPAAASANAMGAAGKPLSGRDANKLLQIQARAVKLLNGLGK